MNATPEDTLSPRRKAIIAMRAEGKAAPEIAEVLGTSTDSINSTITQLRAMGYPITHQRTAPPSEVNLTPEQRKVLWMRRDRTSFEKIASRLGVSGRKITRIARELRVMGFHVPREIKKGEPRPAPDTAPPRYEIRAVWSNGGKLSVAADSREKAEAVFAGQMAVMKAAYPKAKVKISRGKLRQKAVA